MIEFTEINHSPTLVEAWYFYDSLRDKVTRMTISGHSFPEAYVAAYAEVNPELIYFRYRVEDPDCGYGGNRNKWKDRPRFAQDADITVYWPDVRPEYEGE